MSISWSFLGLSLTRALDENGDILKVAAFFEVVEA